MYSSPAHPYYASPYGGPYQQQQQQHQQELMPSHDARQALTIASLQNQLLATAKEVSQAAEQLMRVNAENAELKKSNDELHNKLEATRDALRETRDSLEQVQAVIKPLNLAQRAKEQQLQQLAAMNRLYEAKITDYETKFRQAEATIKRHIQLNESSAGDEALIEKLHERLISSQNALVKSQSDLQRLQVANASTEAELTESRRTASALDVQILVQNQAHQQQIQALRDQAAARENSLYVELSSCKRRLVVLEEQVQLQLSLREASRREEVQFNSVALSNEIKAAMGKISAMEDQRQMVEQLQKLGARSSSSTSSSSPTNVAAAEGAGGGSGYSPNGNSKVSSPRSPEISGGEAPLKVSPLASKFRGNSLADKLMQAAKVIRSGSSAPGIAARGPPPVTSAPAGVAKSVDLGNNMKLMANQIIDIDEPPASNNNNTTDLGSPGSPGSVSSEINVPIFFRPLNDINEEIESLEREREKIVKSIKEWTEAFVKSARREPTPADIARSPEAKALYNEMDEVSAANSFPHPLFATFPYRPFSFPCTHKTDRRRPQEEREGKGKDGDSVEQTRSMIFFWGLFKFQAVQA